ncbi:hypothetical protein O181_029002 [Austropuccinia psidii MF-1]|uniref:Uncharacterized protein n=1 Tax=Austropuccinia psidii MF-1 TaxID=1389203 RepID=A0A9Q3CVP5_9BASI|nr:hypothetical protein [Austropuccinia psidii MF-1]
MGSLIFKGGDNKTVGINRVFYSSDAACTLISPVALIFSRARISTDGNEIIIFNGSKLPILHTCLCQSKLKWEMPPYLPKIMGIENSQTDDLTESSSKASTGNPTLGQLILLETNLDNDGNTINNVALLDKHSLTDLLHSIFRHIGNKFLATSW